MSLIIKVCGIQTLEEATGAVKAGANTLGFLIGVPEYVEDKITPEKAKQILDSVPEGIRTVMVTHLMEVNEILKIAIYIGVSAIQVHNDLDTEGMKRLQPNIHNLELIKAIHVLDNTAVDQAKMYEPYADLILLDTKVKGRIGGTGQTHDWDISRRIVKEISIPVILAGGLNPQNVNEALSTVKPAGIDANSGLENEEGLKDFEKIRLFAREAGLLS
jgi:phosphoribosylanthranilate isomerase